MRLRHFFMPVAALFFSSLIISFILAIQGTDHFIAAWVVLCMALFANAFLPSLFSGWIFYLLVRKNEKQPKSIRQLLVISVLFIIICAALLFLWAFLEAVVSSPFSFENVWKVYRRDFIGWNLIQVMDGIMVPFLFFDKKFLRIPDQVAT